MTLLNKCTIGAIIGLIVACNSAKQTEKTLVEPIYFGDIRPQGWLKEQMVADLNEGFLGHLDQLVPELIIADDIYGKDRMTKGIKSKDVGAITDDSGDWQVQFLWWNSETQSNWWDGYIRHAILTLDGEALEKVKAYVYTKLSTQDADGYIGVYAPDLRYAHATENGELWAQASLFRGLLAYYEFSKEERVFTAIQNAVNLTMKNYPIGKSQPFNVEMQYAGVGHGLMFVDVLERLHTLTGREDYLEYAKFLYDDYNLHATSEVDIQTKNLNNPDYKFKGHGVHTYEHLRALAIATYRSKDPNYKKALDFYLKRLTGVITPSGAPIGDEWIFERKADADKTGYEYCSLHELLDSYSLLLRKTGEAQYADKMEWLLFNAAQGARHPDGKSIAYCKTDNSYHMRGALELENVGKNNHNRYKYSPVHQDVAVCCVPNAGRIYPYYINSMWEKDSVGLVLNLFGPSDFSTQIDGATVLIRQETNYPFDFDITLKLEIDRGTPEFQIAIRKPKWMDKYSIQSEARRFESEDYILLENEWKNGDEIKLKFETNPRINTDLQGHSFVSYGPLVFGLPLAGREVITKDYDIKKFHDLIVESDVTSNKKYSLKDSQIGVLETQEVGWDHVKLKVKLVDAKGAEISSLLEPMGNLVLRQVTFPISN